jgi:prepilin-type N-terminal cleavage/methylation domain-containing protein
MKNNGYSLTELVTVIAILGTLLATAGISGKTWLSRYRVEAQTKELFTDLMNARVSALQRNRMHFVNFAGAQYTIYEDTDPRPDGDGALRPNDDTLVLQKSTQFPIISVLGGSPPAAGFSFDKNGLVSLATPTTVGTLHFDVETGTEYDCITLCATRILMGKWNGGDCVAQ